MKCVIVGHKISTRCQRELKKSPSKKYPTTCERCGYPLILEIDAKDGNRFYYTEQDSVKEIFPEIKE